MDFLENIECFEILILGLRKIQNNGFFWKTLNFSFFFYFFILGLQKKKIQNKRFSSHFV